MLDRKLGTRAAVVGLGCEVAALFGASWLPGGFPNLAFVPLIAVVAAYQAESFRKADGYAYNSTFMTGNLRMAVDGMYEAMHLNTRAEGGEEGSASVVDRGELPGGSGGGRDADAAAAEP